ncbi:DNA-directed RNA polymerase subunit K [archaeon]|nr:DNA-directed RNA polymerase subunit K [archaeon]
MIYTKYEKARILGARALQLAMGAPPLVKPSKEATPIDLALEEIEKDVVPITILEE